MTRIDLAGFGDVDMLALMETAAGHELTEPGVALAQALRRETKGNPFFTGEMLRHLALSGAIAQSAAGRFELQQSIAEMGLPTSVRDVVARRVDRLGGDAVTVLRAAAVIGLNFDLDLLVELVDLDEDSVLDVLEAATIASLVEDAPEQVGGFTFRHGLVQQTLAQDLSATRRQRIHRRIAEVLQTRVGTNLASPAELAVHFIAATRPVDADQAVHYATAAGDAAMEALASVDAVNWYSQALALHLARPNFDEGLRCDLLTKLGTAQRDSGDPAFRERSSTPLPVRIASMTTIATLPSRWRSRSADRPTSGKTPSGSRSAFAPQNWSMMMTSGIGCRCWLPSPAKPMWPRSTNGANSPSRPSSLHDQAATIDSS